MADLSKLPSPFEKHQLSRTPADQALEVGRRPPYAWLLGNGMDGGPLHHDVSRLSSSRRKCRISMIASNRQTCLLLNNLRFNPENTFEARGPMKNHGFTPYLLRNNYSSIASGRENGGAQFTRVYSSKCLTSPASLLVSVIYNTPCTLVRTEFPLSCTVARGDKSRWADG